ncbi:hypothetical protein RvY_11913 [Ramazzottius varieornatus]|uniref:Splicing factor YJU2 n=1 Tax=Ramazzottius varieornatus TaxID=947166 RepID=A0A1D1VJQ7_RAMVA|nr:hypothetical protein RvY_11913 [Ramazzottius varieornatus]
MTERKVINKYYPPDFDPTKLPRLKLQKNRQFNVRIMAPCNMKCNTCGEYIYKGKKFNSRQETVDGETYLELRIYRFYIKCPRCMSEITFKTNLVEMDYDLENGATRNFQAVRLAEMEEERQDEARAEEEKSNPMIALERRTQDSRSEMDRLEALEEIRDLNMRQANVNYDQVIKMTVEKEMQAMKEQEEADEAFIKSIFSKEEGPVIKRLLDDDEDDDDQPRTSASLTSSSGDSADILTAKLDSSVPPSSLFKKPKIEEKKVESWEKSIGSSSKIILSSLVKVKPAASTPPASLPVVQKPSSSSVSTSKSAVQNSGLNTLLAYGGSDEDDSN